MTTVQEWQIKGHYIESCNCEVLCPCSVPGSPQIPTEGHCDMALAFHIYEGNSGSIDMSGLGFVVVMYTPGKMTEPDWTTAIYVDERANQEQRTELEKIVSGETGGPMERFMALTENFLGIKYVPINFSSEGPRRRVPIPSVMEFNVEGIVREGQSQPMRLENWRPWAPLLVMAKGAGTNTYSDHDMNWDNAGKNGHYADFQWP
jgi:hypothetical protein